MAAVQLSIRRAIIADAERLEQVRFDARAAVESAWPNAVSMASRLSVKAVFTYLVEGATPFGFVTVGPPEEEFYQDGTTGEVLEWYLSPAHWRAGMGKKLMVHGLSVLKRRQFEQGLIWVPVDQIAAEQCIESLGFEPEEAEKIDNANPGYKARAWLKDLSGFF